MEVHLDGEDYDLNFLWNARIKLNVDYFLKLRKINYFNIISSESPQLLISLEASVSTDHLFSYDIDSNLTGHYWDSNKKG